MGFARTYRLIEGSFITLFFLQAARVAMAMLLTAASRSIQGGEADISLIYAAGGLVAAALLPLLAPRRQAALPGLLWASAGAAAVARLGMVVQKPVVQLAAAVAVMGFGAVYASALLRANWRRWVSVWIVALTIDQLLRAVNTYDPSLRAWLQFQAGESVVAVPWAAIQGALTVLVLGVSVLARRSTRHEPYRPARLNLGGGLALGGFLALEMLALAHPAVSGRWTGVAVTTLMPWLLLATALPLSAGIRQVMGEALNPFPRAMQGVVWLALLMIALIVGNRLDGLGAAGALVAAQFMLVLLLWWLPIPGESDKPQTNIAVSAGVLAFLGLATLYGLTFEYAHGLGWLRDQGLVVLLGALGLAALPRLWGQVSDPWLAPSLLPRGVAATFIAPVFVFGLIAGGLDARPVAPLPGDVLRVATYNVNHGYDAGGHFQLELAAQTIAAAAPDVVLLQEVEAGHPASFGIDQVTFLARRLDMYAVYYPTVEQLRGLAILSRWPLSGAGGLLLPGEGEQLGALRAVLPLDAASGRSLTLVNTRLAAGDEAGKLGQIGVLLGLLGESRPAVLGGDLAMAPEEEAFRQLLMLGLTDADVALGLEGGYTVPAEAPTVRHDYVLLRDLEPLDSRQVQSAASDHRLVVVEVRWHSD